MIIIRKSKDSDQLLKMKYVLYVSLKYLYSTSYYDHNHYFIPLQIICFTISFIQFWNMVYIMSSQILSSKKITYMQIEKNYKLALIAFLMTLIISCNSSPTQNSAINIKRSETDSTFNICYSSVVKKDTVLLNALMFGDSIKGSLGYKLYEKDQNNGSVLGKMYGDTLRMMYTYISEGTESIREVVFLKKDTLLIEGFGDLKKTNEKVIFEDIQKVKFNGLVLQKVPCK